MIPAVENRSFENSSCSRRTIPSSPLSWALQEGQGVTDAAEDTLLTTRRQFPDDIETYRRLAQFYVRRVTAMNATVREQTPAELPNPGQPDQNGVYQIGGSFPPPRRLGVASYPEDAKTAGIKGAVQTEIVIDETGAVVDAQVLKSVPLLDEAAIAAVKEWRFTPKIVNGRPVPVKMTVTVNFAQ
jgi:TonB family protein